MADDARIEAGTAYRGFLFADMRGFTAFAERHGNTAAAAAVTRFLEISRRAIARHAGGEIKTEGDAIHAVFPSASSAVLCGLEIVDAAAELNIQEPDRPLGIGVGVHAGEAVETAEGYIGRAVNIAARLCAAARPGEVLVSSTVKGITQSSIRVGFIPRGSRRLKGIQDPILVYSVTRDMAARAPRGVPRPVLLGAAGVGLVVVVAIAMLAGSQLFGNPGASKAPDGSAAASEGALADPLVMGPLEVGTYTTQAFEPAVIFRIEDAGWTANRDVAGLLSFIRDSAPRGGVQFLRVEEVIQNPCVSDGEGTSTGPADLLTLLADLTHLTRTGLRSTEVGGYPARQLDVTVSDSVFAACGGLVGDGAAIFRAGEETWRAAPGERFRLIAVDVEGQTVTILLSTDWTQTASVQELEDLLEAGERILATVEFLPAS